MHHSVLVLENEEELHHELLPKDAGVVASAVVALCDVGHYDDVVVASTDDTSYDDETRLVVEVESSWVGGEVVVVQPCDEVVVGMEEGLLTFHAEEGPSWGVYGGLT